MSERVLLRCFFVLALALPVESVSLGEASGQAGQAVQPLDVREIAPGVYAHEAPITAMNAASGGDIGNNGFIVGDDAVAVVDTGGAPIIGERLKRAIEKITDKPIRYVINTHEHPDYTFGNVAFVAPGVTFVGHENLPRSMAARGPHYIQTLTRDMGAALLNGVKLIPPTLLVHLNKGMRLDLGHRIIDLHAWPPGATDCDLTVFDEKTKTLFAGDLLFLQHVPVIDASLSGWLKDIPQLAAIPARLAVSAHGPVGVAWPQALDAEKAYFLKLSQDVRGILAKGEDINVAAREAGQSEASKWRLFDVYNSRNATAAYAELEWQ